MGRGNKGSISTTGQTRLTSFSLAQPNQSHPSFSDALRALSPSPSNKNRSHPTSYHCFLVSDYYKKHKDNNTLPRQTRDPIHATVLHLKLLKWYDSVKLLRKMPWRKEVDILTLSQQERTQRGYEVWVSETMLQQTQVATVISYFDRWIQKFPTLASLAKADIEDVNAVWAGLGYYSRASRLLKGAQMVVNEFGGVMPETVKRLEEIDGIGAYTAGAISSIAFSKRAPTVDGNITRVLSRLTALHSPSTAKSTTTFLWSLADVLVPPNSGGDEQLDHHGGPNKPGAWNQALMELGATICTPKNPKCGECPLREECLGWNEVRTLAHLRTLPTPAPPVKDIEDCHLCTPFPVIRHEHSVTQYPMAKEKKKIREEETAVCVVEWEKDGAKGGDKMVLLQKRPEKGLLAGLFEFPSIDLDPSENSTPKSRNAQLQELLDSLLVDTLPSISPTSTTTNGKSQSKNPSPIRIISTTSLGAITQIYSHQTRLYHILRVIITSPTLPALSPSSKSSTSVSTTSIPGRGKWVPESDVKGSNVGGAIGKVWDVRMSGKAGVGKLSGMGNNNARDGSVKKVAAGVTGKKGSASPKKREKGRTKEDDDFLVGSDEEIEYEKEEPKRKKKKRLEDKVDDDREEGTVVAESASPYQGKKKRVIVISDDDEEE
ncbi:DNA glycosylase [Meredithblackwellia eburnea MCA 4105]